MVLNNTYATCYPTGMQAKPLTEASIMKWCYVGSTSQAELIIDMTAITTVSRRKDNILHIDTDKINIFIEYVAILCISENSVSYSA